MSADITVHDLKVLSIGYYIQGAIAGCYSLLMLAYAAIIGVLFATVGKTAELPGGRGIDPAFLPLIVAIVSILLTLGFAYTVCLLISGYWLTRQRNRIFIQVIAATNCLFLPYGTVLGIFTFMVLHRPIALQLFSPPVVEAIPDSPA